MLVIDASMQRQWLDEDKSWGLRKEKKGKTPKTWASRLYRQREAGAAASRSHKVALSPGGARENMKSEALPSHLGGKSKAWKAALRNER